MEQLSAWSFDFVAFPPARPWAGTGLLDFFLGVGACLRRQALAPTFVSMQNLDLVPEEACADVFRIERNPAPPWLS
jgi:hypothetical protein